MIRQVLFLAVMVLCFTTITATARSIPSLKMDVQGGYLAAKECNRRVGGFDSQLAKLRARRTKLKKLHPPLLPETRGTRKKVNFLLYYARTQYMAFQNVPKRHWKDYCRLRLGKALRRTRSLR